MQKGTSTWPVAMCACLAIAGIFGANQALLAQSFYGSMVGTVTDASGAVISEATVTLINLGTSETEGGYHRWVGQLPVRQPGPGALSHRDHEIRFPSAHAR